MSQLFRFLLMFLALTASIGILAYQQISRKSPKFLSYSTQPAFMRKKVLWGKNFSMEDLEKDEDELIRCKASLNPLDWLKISYLTEKVLKAKRKVEWERIERQEEKRKAERERIERQEEERKADREERMIYFYNPIDPREFRFSISRALFDSYAGQKILIDRNGTQIAIFEDLIDNAAYQIVNLYIEQELQQNVRVLMPTAEERTKRMKAWQKEEKSIYIYTEAFPDQSFLFLITREKFKSLAGEQALIDQKGNQVVKFEDLLDGKLYELMKFSFGC